LIIGEHTISNAKVEELDRIHQIADSEFGEGYLRIEDKLNSTGHFIKVIKSCNIVVGFCYFFISDEKSSLTIIYDEDKRFESDLSKFGIIKSIAIDKDYRNKGLGIKLMQSCINDFELHFIKEIFCIAWKAGENTNLHHILTKLGFEKNKEILNYWKKDSLKKNYACPECGNPPCLCAAVIYRKNKT